MMSVLYNYLDANGNITNDPYGKTADGGWDMSQQNKWQGRADGYDGGTTGLGMAANAGDGYITQNIPTPSANPTPMPLGRIQSGSTNRLNYGGASFGGGRSYVNDADGAGFIGSNNSTYGPNPYLKDQANAIQAQSNQNLAQNVMPGIRSGAQANGQYGSSRQGIAEGVAAGNAAAGMGSAISGLYGGAYNTDQANQTQRMGIGANYNLGMGNLGLGYFNAGNNYNLGLGSLGNSATGQNQNFYTQQRAQDLQQMQLGAGMYGSGINGQVGVGTGLYGVGNSAYQAPLNSLQQYSNVVTPYTGLNSAQQIDSTKGGGAMGALGGAVAGAQLASNNLGFGNIGGSAGSTQNWTYGGSGTTRSPSSSSDIDAILNGGMLG